MNPKSILLAERLGPGWEPMEPEEDVVAAAKHPCGIQIGQLEAKHRFEYGATFCTRYLTLDCAGESPHLVLKELRRRIIEEKAALEMALEF